MSNLLLPTLVNNKGSPCRQIHSLADYTPLYNMTPWFQFGKKPTYCKKKRPTTCATAPNVAHISVVIYLWSTQEKKKINFAPLFSRTLQIAKASNVIHDFFTYCIVSRICEGLHQGMDNKLLFISEKPNEGGGHNGGP